MGIHLKRGVIDLDTRLRDIPEEWLRHIEPRVVRGGFLPCWIWAGPTDPNGYPIFKHPVTGKYAMVHRFALGLFFDYPPEYYVVRLDTCGYENCINPSHFRIQEKHPTTLLRLREGWG